MQTGTQYKVCTGKNINKEANTGALKMNGNIKYTKLAGKSSTCVSVEVKPDIRYVMTKKILSHAMQSVKPP